MVNVAIIDDNRVVRLGIKSIISNDDINIIGEAENGIEGVEMALKIQPDVLLLDLYLPDITGVEVCNRIHKKSPEMKIIFVTECQNLAILYKLLQTSAHGLIRKNGDFKGRVAILDVYSGKRYVQPDLAHDLIHYKSKNYDLGAITNTEFSVLISCFNNFSRDEITENSLKARPKANRGNLSKIMNKLGIEDILELQVLLDAYPDPEIFPELVSGGRMALNNASP